MIKIKSYNINKAYGTKILRQQVGQLERYDMSVTVLNWPFLQLLVALLQQSETRTLLQDFMHVDCLPFFGLSLRYLVCAPTYRKHYFSAEC